MTGEEIRPTICHVLHRLNVGGAERLALQFAEHFQSHYRPVFLCLDELGDLGAELRDRGNIVEVTKRRPGFDLGCARRIAKFMKAQNVKLVHAHQYGPFFYSSLARFFGGRYRVLFTEHGRDYPDYRRRKRVFANRILLRRDDQVIAVGDCVKKALADYEGISNDRIRVIRNGVDTEVSDKQSGQRRSVRQELGLEESDVAVVQVARLNRLKDHETALNSVELAVQRCPNLRWVIIGDGEERSHIQDLIEQKQLDHCVRMLGTRHDVARLLQGMDGFLLSSITEGIPLTLIEAMLAGLPCIATDVGGNSEVIDDGVTGCLVPPRDFVAMSAAIVRMIDDPTSRRQMGKTGQIRAAREFNAAKMFSSYECIYHDLIKPANSSCIQPDVKMDHFLTGGRT